MSAHEMRMRERQQRERRIARQIEKQQRKVG
jgi:hypothetical protein